MATVKPRMLFVTGIPTCRERWEQGYHRVHEGFVISSMHTASEARRIAGIEDRKPEFIELHTWNPTAQAPSRDLSVGMKTYTFVVDCGQAIGGVHVNVIENMLQQVMGVMLIGHTKDDRVMGVWRGAVSQLKTTGVEPAADQALAWHLERIGLSRPDKLDITLWPDQPGNTGSRVVWSAKRQRSVGEDICWSADVFEYP